MDHDFYEPSGASARVPLNAVAPSSQSSLHSAAPRLGAASAAPSFAARIWRRKKLIGAILVAAVFIWLVVLSAQLARLLGQNNILGNTPITTTLPMSTIGCSGSSTLYQGTPVSLSDREMGSVIVGGGTTSYVGGVKVALQVPQVSEADPLIIALDSTTALLVYSTPEEQAVAMMVQNGGVAPGTKGAQQWLSGQTISPTPHALPFPPDGGILLSRSFATTNYLLAFVGGNGKAVLASITPSGALQFGNITHYANSQYSLDAKMTALDATSFAVSYFDLIPGTARFQLYAAIALINPATLSITMGTPVAYSSDHSFHGISRLINNAFLLTFPADNATAIVNDDDEAVGYPMSCLIATMTLIQKNGSIAPAIQIWGKNGPGGLPDDADQTDARPWTQSSVRAHSFFRVSEAPVPAQIQMTGGGTKTNLAGGKNSGKPTRLSKLWDSQKAAAQMRSGEAFSATGPITSPVIFRQISAMTVVDRASSDGIRAITIVAYLLAQQGTFSPSQQAFNVSGVDLLFADAGLVTQGGVSGGFRQMELSSFPVLPVPTLATPTVTFGVTVADMSAQAAVVTHLFLIHLLDARVSLPAAKFAAPQSAVDPSGVIVAPSNPNVDPISGQPPYFVASAPMQGLSGILVVVIPNPVNPSPSSPLTANLTLVEHLNNPMGVLEISGQGIACTPGQLTSVIMAGSTGPGITSVTQPPVSALTPAGGASQQTTSLVGGLTAYSTTRGGLTTSRGYSVFYSSGGSSPAVGIDVHTGADSAIGTALGDGSVLVGQ